MLLSNGQMVIVGLSFRLSRSPSDSDPTQKNRDIKIMTYTSVLTGAALFVLASTASAQNVAQMMKNGGNVRGFSTLRGMARTHTRTILL